MRKAFETEARKHGFILDRMDKSGAYVQLITEQAWTVWQAATAAVLEQAAEVCDGYFSDLAKRHAALKVEYDAWMQRKAETIARCPIPDTKEDGGSRMSWLSLRYEAPPNAPTQAPPPTDQEISLAERNVRREYENMAWAENAEKSYQKLKGLQQFFFVSNRESKTRAT